MAGTSKTLFCPLTIASGLLRVSWTLILFFVAVILIETEYKPRIIESDYGDIILVYNSKNGRAFKYLWKNESYYYLYKYSINIKTLLLYKYQYYYYSYQYLVYSLIFM